MASYSINTRKAVRINNFEESGFDLFYETGVGAKLTDGYMNVQIFKKGSIEDFESSYDANQQKMEYKPNEEMLVAFSSNIQRVLSFEKFTKLQELINKVKVLLETENENELNKMQKPKALKKSEIVVGGVYEQEDGTKILYLGSGKYFSDSHYEGRTPCNRQSSQTILAWINDEHTVEYNSETNTLQFAGEIDSRVGVPELVKCIKEIELKNHNNLDLIQVDSWSKTEYSIFFNEGNNFKNGSENTDETTL